MFCLQRLSINLKPECVAWHNAIWQNHKVDIYTECFKMSQKSVECALRGECCTTHNVYIVTAVTIFKGKSVLKNLLAIATNIFIFASIFLKIVTSTWNAFLHAFWPLFFESFIKLRLRQMVKEGLFPVKSSWSEWNCHPLKDFFKTGNNQKSHEARSRL